MSVLVVTEVLSIASEKVTEMLSVIETPLWFSVGEIDETVGDVVSAEISVYSSSSTQEVMELVVGGYNYFTSNSLSYIRSSR